MSDYDNSVSYYAAELRVSERQVRRYCRSGLMPSAELTKGRTGRPKWVIKDTSREAIDAVRGTLEFQRFEPPTFCEPTQIQRYAEGPDGKLVPTRPRIAWPSLYAAPIRDRYSLIVTLAHRAALRLHGLTERDISNPPVWRNCRFYDTYPPHEKKILAFERTESRLLYGLFKPKTSKQYRWARQILTKDLREADITRAAEHLAIFHQTHGIALTHQSLAQVLGMSKSSLYRTYRRLVGEALKLAHKKAVAPTLEDRRVKERNQHPGLKRETYQQETESGQPQIASSASDAESAEDDERDNRDVHAYNLLSRRVPRDLAFEHLYNAVLTLHAAGKPIDGRNISAVLRKQGVLAEGEKLSDYFGPIDVANAVRAVTESQGSPAHQKAPPCPAT
jgi:AraC-like DNA-binding protein